MPLANIRPLPWSNDEQNTSTPYADSGGGKDKSVHTEEISWQGGTEKKMLTELSANEIAIDLLLDYSKLFEV